MRRARPALFTTDTVGFIAVLGNEGGIGGREQRELAIFL